MNEMSDVHRVGNDTIIAIRCTSLISALQRVALWRKEMYIVLQMTLQMQYDIHRYE